MAIIPFLIVFSLLIFFHEFGHFLFARIFGVAVSEFGFGYPPRLWGKRIGNTLYSINLIPFGGFAKIKGTEAEVSGFGDADSFAVQSPWKRILILCGGVFGNLILAWLIFTALSIAGNPAPAGKVYVDSVSAGSPAAQAGIKAGDYIVSVDGEKVETATELVDLTSRSAGRAVALVVEQNGGSTIVSITPRTSPPAGEGPLGFAVSTGIVYVTTPFWRAPIAGAVESFGAIAEMARLFVKLISDLVKGESVLVGGPVAILALSGTYASYGVRIFAQFIALLSLNLLVINLLPFPALDGGRLAFVAVELVLRRKISDRTEQFINSVGFALLLIIMILVSIRDVQVFF
jgi:regulator of sigma E protease